MDKRVMKTKRAIHSALTRSAAEARNAPAISAQERAFFGHWRNRVYSAFPISASTPARIP